jgi:hypothetical protein
MSKRTKGALVAALLVVIALAVVLLRLQARLVPSHVVAVAQSAPRASAAPGTLIDALVPNRPMLIDSGRSEAADWVRARPGFQYSRSAAERGGVEPCATQEVDTSEFEDWAPLDQGRFIAPRDFGLDQQGHFDLVIHLHGQEPVRRELIKSGARFVLYTLTLDPSQSYAPLFSGTGLYQAIISGIEETMSKRSGRAAHAGHVALSAWSAGFVGIEAALAQPGSRDIDAVVLIDGLHAPRGDSAAFKAQLQPFVDYAKRAAAGEKFMFISHSSIDPPDFASTTECAHYLLAALGAQPQPVKRQDALGLELVEYFSRGNLHVRGYAGNDKPDHCAQLATLRDVYAALRDHWQRPTGT